MSDITVELSAWDEKWGGGRDGIIISIVRDTQRVKEV